MRGRMGRRGNSADGDLVNQAEEESHFKDSGHDEEEEVLNLLLYLNFLS
jgi:hypothetical protein